MRNGRDGMSCRLIGDVANVFTAVEKMLWMDQSGAPTVGTGGENFQKGRKWLQKSGEKLQKEGRGMRPSETFSKSHGQDSDGSETQYGMQVVGLHVIGDEVQPCCGSQR